MFRRVSTCLIIVCVASMASAASLPSTGGEYAMAPADVAKTAAGTKTDVPSKKGRFPPFAKVTKDMTKREGLFTLWSYPKSVKDKNTEKLLCQVPKSFLGEKFMLSTSFSGGGFFTGFPLEERVVQWELLDKQLLLVEPETGFVMDKKDTVSDVVRRTYPERIRAAVPVVTKSPEGDPLIDLGKMLKSNFADIAWMSRGPFGGGGSGGGVNSALSRWTKKKTFEFNVEIGVELAIRRKSPPGSYDKKLVHFSFWRLPKSDYKPRIADDRVGYFLTANQDWAKPTGSRDIFNRYIDRWHLVKRDSSLSLCEPKQPIIFYIEKTVPVRFRRAVRDGILEWNKAFEKIGFINAIEVRQQTGDNEWKDLDPEDMRYSFFRWIVTGAGFAMGPHRSNPFTGQIYDADIIFDDSMVRFFERSAVRNLPSAAIEMTMNDPPLREFFRANPQFRRPERSWESFSFCDDEETSLRDAMIKRLRRRGQVGCDYYEGMKHQVAVGYAMLAGQPKEVIEKFLYDIIKEVVAHEVGHTLGLRHNFKASTIYSLDEIKRRRGTDEPTTGSVMDYNPVLFVGDNLAEGNFITPTIGPYDYWAIEYGYRPDDGTYKAPGQEGETDELPDEDAEESAEVAAGTDGDTGIDGISQELLDKLPPDVRKLIKERAERKGDNKPEESKEPGAPAGKDPPAGAQKMLQAIASRASEPQLAYATDEDTTFFGPDPRANRFDLAGDPIESARERARLIDRRLGNILDWAVKDGESWYHMRPTFLSLVFEKARMLAFVGRYIGGQYTNRSHRADTDGLVPFELVGADRQRAALTFIEESLFDDSFFAFSPEVLNHLSVPRWSHRGMRVSYTVDFPLHRLISRLQWSNLFARFFPNTLRRIHDAELKTSEAEKFTVAEYLQRLHKACWADTLDNSGLAKATWTDSSPFISSTRRSLQREYLNVVEPLVRTPPGRVLSPDLHAMVQHSLRKAGAGIARVLESGKLDFASEAHLASCSSRIERVLAPQLDEFR